MQFIAGTPAPGCQQHVNYDLEVLASGSLYQLMFNEAVIAASSKAIIVRWKPMARAVTKRAGAMSCLMSKWHQSEAILFFIWINWIVIGETESNSN